MALPRRMIVRLMPGAVRAVAAAILALGAATAIAQTEAAAARDTQYVVEQLVVSVSSEPEGAGERVDQIKSGDRVEVLGRQDDHSRVRLSSGREGWVRSSYLSTTPPMREQLKARTDELEKLRTEKSKLETELANARQAAAANAAAASAASATPPPTALSVPVAASNDLSAASPSKGPSVTTAATDSAQSSNPSMFASDDLLPSRPSWIAAITLSVLTLAAGFVLGWRVLDKRIRAKYGGLRIY